MVEGLEPGAPAFGAGEFRGCEFPLPGVLNGHHLES